MFLNFWVELRIFGVSSASSCIVGSECQGSTLIQVMKVGSR